MSFDTKPGFFAPKMKYAVGAGFQPALNAHNPGIVTKGVKIETFPTRPEYQQSGYPGDFE
ncbi:MAG: hypothetical protein HC910_03645 [Spirulinaceae cyanobacterium SM2_1_0]|nr:hypothetical protein [Spirulinaceae cyanobacterium SM2_1_0]